MIRLSSLILISVFSLASRAQTLSVVCNDVKSGTNLEADPYLKPDFYGDTMQVRISSSKKPTRYDRFHQLDLANGITFRGAMATNPYLDHIELNLGNSVGSAQLFPNAELKTHEDIYDAKTDKWSEVRTAISVSCEVKPAPDFSNPCRGKTKSDFNKQLLQAAIDKSTDDVLQAISCGAEVNTTNSFGCTPLMLASETTNFECGVTTRAKDSFLFRRAKAIFSTLLESGAYAVQSDVNGNTALHKIIKNGEDAMLKELIGLAEDLDVQNKEGMTPLMLAAKNGYRNAVKDLVAAGANIELKNNFDQTAYDLGQGLDADTRSLLLAPSITVVITGQDSGGCNPQSFEIPMGKAVKLKFTAAKSKMFLLAIPAAKISVMADGGATVEKTFKIEKAGTYPFQCGVHGGTQTNGTVIVK